MMEKFGLKNKLLEVSIALLNGGHKGSGEEIALMAHSILKSIDEIGDKDIVDK